MGADAIAAGRLMGGAGLNGDRHWGTHFLTSSLPFGFTDYFPEGSGNGEQNTLHHEYFHVVQQAHIFTKDRNERDALLGPVWFIEDGADYMAQVTVKDGLSSGLVTSLNMDGRRWPGFEADMKQKMDEGLRNLKEVCPDSKLQDMDYQNDCNGAQYDLGSWGHAYLANKFGADVLLNTFYPQLNSMSWEEAFLFTYGISSSEFYVQFDEFLDLPWSGKVKILL
jgi:hypothetical protein|tara:strand:+ start:900 stop:1568 length:669 start_codon:yes stop_codon:yes gene_type:complete